MEDYKLKKYKDILLEEKERIENILEHRDGYANEELSNVDNHPADIGTEMFMKEQDEGFKASYKGTLEKIDISLLNIEDGSFGNCISCNKDIEEERLEAIPYTSLCSDCMDEDESGEIHESLDEAYITQKSSSRENVQFDREDSYQDVAEFEKISKDPSDSTGDYMGIFDDEDRNRDDIENISQDYYDDTLE